MHAQDYATAEEFFDDILAAWAEEWQRVYSFDWAQSQPFEDGEVDYAVYYNSSIKILSVISQGSSNLSPCPLCHPNIKTLSF